MQASRVFIVAMAFVAMAISTEAAPLYKKGFVSDVWNWLGFSHHDNSPSSPSSPPSYSAPSVDGPKLVVDIPSTAHILERPVPVAFIVAPHRDGPARYVAFGDSYSAGFGADPGFQSDNRCRQGQRAYPNLLAEDMKEFTLLLAEKEAATTTTTTTASLVNGSTVASLRNDTSSSGSPIGALRARRISRVEAGEAGPNSPSSLVARGSTVPEHLLWLSCSGALTEDLMAFDESRAYKVRKDEGWSLFDIFSKPDAREGFGYADADWTGPFLSSEQFSRQIDAWEMTEDTDMATLSLGGNDLGFTPILNACVFRFTKSNCKKAIDVSVQKLKGGAFKQRYFDILDYIFEKADTQAHPWFVVTVTGYAKFFNAETDQCDHARFSPWPKSKTTMTKGTRRLVNNLVDLIRDELRTIVDEYNLMRFGDDQKVLFVDIDPNFEGHRFCEAGVAEPDRGNANNWFFNYLGWDHEVDSISQEYAALVEVEELRKVEFPSCLLDSLAQDEGPKLQSLGMCMLRFLVDWDPSQAPPHWHWQEHRAGKAHETLEQAETLVHEAEKMWERVEKRGEMVGDAVLERRFVSGTISYMPTIIGKLFHPKWAGHRAIRDAIYKRWVEVGWAVPVTDFLDGESGQTSLPGSLPLVA